MCANLGAGRRKERKSAGRDLGSFQVLPSLIVVVSKSVCELGGAWGSGIYRFVGLFAAMASHSNALPELPCQEERVRCHLVGK